MTDIRNPARSRPLSKNVQRLMKMSRESPKNPNVKQSTRDFTARDYTYCEMQGNIFMAAVDRGLDMADFAPIYMTSQLAGVIDYSFSCANEMESDTLSNLLQIPVLLKSPGTIVDVVLWLNRIVSALHEDDSANLAVARACCESPENTPPPTDGQMISETPAVEELTARYEYAFWLGYIYRYECLLHEESSRMVYGAFSEEFMRETFEELRAAEIAKPDGETTLRNSAAGICGHLDSLLVGRLWK